MTGAEIVWGLLVGLGLLIAIVRSYRSSPKTGPCSCGCGRTVPLGWDGLHGWDGTGVVQRAINAASAPPEPKVDLGDLLVTHDAVLADLARIDPALADQFRLEFQPCPNFYDGEHRWIQLGDAVEMMQFGKADPVRTDRRWQCDCGVITGEFAAVRRSGEALQRAVITDALETEWERRRDDGQFAPGLPPKHRARVDPSPTPGGAA